MNWLGHVMIRVKLSGPKGSAEREALVDTGSTTSSVPADVAEILGLQLSGHKPVKSFTGVTNTPWVRELRIEIMGRAITTDAIIAPAGSQTIVGCRQLEALNLIVRPGKKDVVFDEQVPRGRPGRYHR